MWIKAKGGLVNLDRLNSCFIINTGVKYGLIASYNGTPIAIDSYDSEEDAISAMEWFYLLLTGEIDVETWEKGRHDPEFRNAGL